MANDVSDATELPYYCPVKVHCSLCLELKKIIDKISRVFSAIESARPRCISGLQILCSLHSAIHKAKLLIQQCSDSSKLYLAITADRIVLRCENVRNTIELCLSQIQNMVPQLLALEISRIVDDLRHANFIVENAEDEAGKVVRALLREDIPASNSTINSELEALQLAALRLNITTPIAILIEKRSIKKLLEKVHDKDPVKKKILRYLLYLLRKYGEIICGHGTECVLSGHDGFLNQSFDQGKNLGNSNDKTQAHECGRPGPPEEFKCPISMRLMHDPVVIASGQTFDRVWIEKWFSDGNNTCPVTHMKLPHMSMTPNSSMKTIISKWCSKHDFTISDPCLRPIPGFHFSQEASCISSIASFGSSMKDLNLQISSVSLRSSDTNSGSDTLQVKIDDGFSNALSQMTADFRRCESSATGKGMNLACLSKLGTLPWESQCKAVEDMNKHLEDSNKAHLVMCSTSYIKPLIRFLKTAREVSDLKSQRDGANLLLAILNKSRSDMPPLQEDALYVLVSFIDSGISEEALAIMELLSCQRYYRTQIVTSGVLPFILKVFDTQIRKNHLPAMKILCNLSSNSKIGYHFVYLDCMAKIVPFLDDCILSGYCIKILRDLLNTEEALAALCGTNICIASIAELLEGGTKEIQECAMDVLLSLCYHSAEYRQLASEESIVLSLCNIFVNGNSRGKVIAMKLLQLLRDSTDGEAPDCPIPSHDLKLDRPGNVPKELKPSAKSSKLLRGRFSKFMNSHQ